MFPIKSIESLQGGVRNGPHEVANIKPHTQIQQKHEFSALFSSSPDKRGGINSAVEAHCDALPSHPCCPSSIYGASDFQVSFCVANVVRTYLDLL